MPMQILQQLSAAAEWFPLFVCCSVCSPETPTKAFALSC